MWPKVFWTSPAVLWRDNLFRVHGTVLTPHVTAQQTAASWRLSCQFGFLRIASRRALHVPAALFAEEVNNRPKTRGIGERAEVWERAFLANLRT